MKDLYLIRHAASVPAGHLYGRTDADIGDIAPETIRFLQSRLARCTAIYSSPARRCVKSCHAVFPQGNASVQHNPTEIPQFWEQSFGTWEGLAYDKLPDIGDLSGEALTHFTPPDGESFVDVCKRVQPALLDLVAQDSAEAIAIFGHAGMIRAILALAFGSQTAALRCEIGHLSLTRLRVLPQQQFSVVCINATS